MEEYFGVYENSFLTLSFRCSDIVWLAAAAGVPESPRDYREPALMSLATLTLGPQ